MEVLRQLEHASLIFLIVRVVLFILEATHLLIRNRLTGDLLPNTACGVIVFLTGRLLTTSVTFAMITFVAAFAPQRMATTWWVFFLTLIGADLAFYLYHSAAHRVRLLWNDHSVHHSSEELDLSTNLRVSPFVRLYSWLPIVPILLLGVNPFLVLVCLALVNDFPFFLHTTRIGKLWRPVEFIFNTPSHHRVHHARNPSYVNKNFGGIFIVWDRLFGTFATETHPCEFGSSRPVNSNNPLTILFSEWILLFQGWSSHADMLQVLLL